MKKFLFIASLLASWLFTSPIYADVEIVTVDQLKAFRDAVNSGTTYAGQTVLLTADLDLSSEANWTPIGNLVAYPGQSFNGVFDGNGHSISNVTVNDNTPNYAVAGLFGSIENGTIKNLTVKNVNLTSTHYAGGIVAYTSNGPTIENCKVIGGTITSTPELKGTTYDNGDKAGGIMGYATAGSTINNCTVEGVTITAYRDLGGIVGFSNGTVTNNTAINVTVTQDLTNGYETSTPTTIGDIVGRGSATNNVEANGNKVIKGDPVAKIGTENYYSLADAVAAAQQMGGEVTINIIDNISGETVTIQEVANFKLTIDGKKDDSSNYIVDARIVIDGLRGNGGSNTNGASVTLQNIAFENSSSADGIQPQHYPHHLTIQDCAYTGSSTSSNKWFVNVTDGPLYGATIKNVTVENTRLIQGNLGLDVVFENIKATNNCTAGFQIKTEGTVLIKDCQVTTAKYAFRDIADEYEGTITLEGNTFVSTSEGSDEGVIVNRSGKVGTGHINVESGTYTGHVKVLNNEGGVLAISGGTFSEDPSANVVEGYSAVKTSDSEFIVVEGTPVARIGSDFYNTLEAAFAAAEDGATITLLADASGNGIVVPQGKYTTGLTVDFDGHTYTVDGETVGSAGTQTNGFQLLKDNKITFQNGTITSTKAKILVQNYSDLTLDGMTLTLNNASYTSAYTLSNNNGTVVIDGSTINANPAGGFAFDVCRYASYPSVNVEVKGESVINGNIEISASGNDAKDGFGLALNGGTMAGNIVLDASAAAAMKSTPEKVSITKADAFEAAAPENYQWVSNGSGTSTLQEIPDVAQFNGVNYKTLQAALDAAEAADPANIVIDLLADATLDITAWNGTKNPLSIGTVNTQSITINGNNHTLTFNQKNSDWNNVATMNDAQTKLILNDIKLTSSGYNNGPWNRHDINFNCAVELNNVTSDKALAFKNAAKLRYVTINENCTNSVDDTVSDTYAIWIQPNGQTIDIDGLIVNAVCEDPKITGRGIKIDEKYVTAQDVSLSIANATFATEAKAAILVKSGAKTNITVGENVNIENVAADKTNLVWVDEDRATEYYKVTTTGATMVPEGGEAAYTACLIRGEQIRGYYKSAIEPAITAAQAEDTVKILKAGEYTLPNLPANITLEGAVDGVVFNHTTGGSVASVPNGATFKNVTFNFGNVVNYHGFQHAGTINMKGCTLNGQLCSYGDMNFTDCQFKRNSETEYNMWCYSGNITYANCTFERSKKGHLHLYNEDGTTRWTVTVNDCAFINDGAANKAAINVKATCGSKLLAYDVIINNCTTEGNFPEAVGDTYNSDNTYIISPLVQVDDRSIYPDNITVKLDDVLVYPVTYVAAIGTKKYQTLEAAVAAVPTDGTATTITMIADETLTGNVVIGGTYGASASQTTAISNQNITLDLNGKNITGDKTIYVAGGSLNITGEGTIETTNDGVAPVGVRYVKYGSDLDYTSKRSLTIGEDVTLKGTYYGLNIFGTNEGTIANNIEVNVNGTVEGVLFVLGNLSNTENNIVINVNGTVTATEDVAIALNGNAKVNVAEGAVVTGLTGIEVRAGELNVAGGTITATASEYSYTANGSGTTVRGAAIAISQHGTLLPTTANVNGGTLEGTKTIAVVDAQNNKLNGVTVKAKDEFVANSVIPEDFMWVSNEGISTLTEKPDVAQIGEVKYKSLAKAVAAVPTDGTATTIELLVDVTENVVTDGGKNIVLDLAGKTLTGYIDQYDSDVEVKNGTVAGTVWVNGGPSTASEGYNHFTLANDATITSAWGFILYQGPNGNDAYGSVIDINGTVNGTAWVMGNITKGNSVINVNSGAKIKGDVFGLNGLATLNVKSGATIIGSETGIEVRAGNLNVEGGTITSTATEYTYNQNGSGTTTTGAAIAVAQHSTLLATNVQILGGTLTGLQTIAVIDSQENDLDGVTVTVADNLLTDKVIIPEEFMWESNGDNTSTLVLSSEQDIVLIDGEPYTYTKTTAVKSVTYKRNISAANTYCAWYVPFDYKITAEDLENYTFYRINLIANAPAETSVTQTEKIWIYLTEMVENEKLTANRPYIFKSKTTGEKEFKVEENAMIYAPEDNIRLNNSTTAYNYDFYGIYAGTTFPVSEAVENTYLYYITGKGQVAKQSAKDLTLGSYRWYIRATQKAGGPNYAPVFVFTEDDDDATGINQRDNVVTEESYYSLDGMRINKPARGAYIIKYSDGSVKKVIK